MEDYEVDEMLEGEGIDKGKLEAALELARLMAEETGLSSEALGHFIWGCYHRLETEEEWEE